jgi:hypothetical protein
MTVRIVNLRDKATVADNFCPRITVIDGLILWVSTIGHFHFIGNRLWLPSPIKFISSKSVSKKESIHSIVIENVPKLERVESKAFEHTGVQGITVPASAEVFDEECFPECRSLSSVTFESGSRLSRIEKQAFFETGLVEIILPASVEILGEKCFFKCKSLSSVTIESGSRLSRIEN